MLGFIESGQAEIVRCGIVDDQCRITGRDRSCEIEPRDAAFSGAAGKLGFELAAICEARFCRRHALRDAVQPNPGMWLIERDINFNRAGKRVLIGVRIEVEPVGGRGDTVWQLPGRWSFLEDRRNFVECDLRIAAGAGAQEKGAGNSGKHDRSKGFRQHFEVLCIPCRTA